MKFQIERIANVLEEAKPLLERHWQEIAHYPDIPLDPDYEQYIKLDDMGLIKAFTARNEDKKLVGYAVFLVRPHIHYRSMLLASQDILFIDKEYRKTRMGLSLIKFCDEYFKSIGVTAVSQHIKAKFDFGRMLKFLGYELMDLIYIKRLN